MKKRMKERCVSIKYNQMLMILIVHFLLVQVASGFPLGYSDSSNEDAHRLDNRRLQSRETQPSSEYDHDPGDFEILGFKFFPSQYLSNRNIRNANEDKSSEFLKHTTVIAHIINGISLQTGLLNGNISIDNVVGELLGFGNVQLPAVINFKPDGIIESAKKMKSIRDSLDDNMMAVMKQILDWDRWIVDAGTIASTDFTKLPGVPEYFKEVRGLNAGFNFSVLATAKDKADVSNFLTPIQNFVNNKNLDTSVHAVVIANINALQTRFKDFVVVMKQLKKETEKLIQLRWLIGKENPFKPLRTVTQLMDNRPKLNKNFDSSQVGKLKSNMQSALDSAKNLKTSTGDTSLVTELMKSRTQLKVRKYTIGFPNGVSELKQLVEDVRDPWIGKILNLDKSQLHVLFDGLQPLIGINDKLSKLDEKLKPVASNKLYESLLNFRDILKDLEGMPAESINSLDVLSNYASCLTRTQPSVETNYKPIQKFLTDVDKLKTRLMSIIQSMDRIDVDKLNQELTEFTHKLGVSKTDGKPPADDKVPGIIAELKKTDDLLKMQKRFQDFTKMFEGFEGDQISTTYQKSVTKGENDIKGQNFLADIDKERNVQICLKTYVDKSTKVSTAVRTLHKMKEVDSGTVSDVESAAKAVSEVSKHLTSVNSIPGDMKKNVNNLTEEIDEMPNSATHSDAIGQSVISLKYAYRMKELETEIGQLKDVGAVVDLQLQKVIDPDEKQRIEKLWGNHNKDIDDLEKLLAGIKSFDANLDVSRTKTMGEYGKPLKRLVKLADVKMNLTEKSKALRALITQPIIDSSVKSDLEKTQKTLEQLSSLDLEFSSHQALYRKTQVAFQALEDFLTQLLSNKTTEDINHESKTALFLVLLVLSLAIVTLIVVFGLWHFKKLCFKRFDNSVICPVTDMDADDKTNPLTEDLLVIMVVTASLGAIQQKYELWMELMKMVVNETRDENRPFPYVQLAIRKYWDVNIPLNPWTALQSIRVHANVFMTRIGSIFTVAQGPMYASDTHDDTRIDFLSMIIKDEMEYAVMIGQAQLADSPKNSDLCPPYFSEVSGGSIKIGPFTVDTLDETPLMVPGQQEVDVKIRTLKITDKRNKKATRTIKHFHMPTWNDEDVPPFGYETCYQVMQTVIKSKKPILVHNTKGVGSAMAFVGLEYTSRMMEFHEEYTYKDGFGKLIEKRYCSFQNARQIGWMHVGSVYFTSRNHNLDMYMFNQMNNVFLEVNRAYSGVPKNESGVNWC